MDHTGKAKISDFGIAVNLSKCGGHRETEFVGTYQYLSPERMNSEPYGFASDIWSFGLIMLFCVVGKFPFDTRTGVLGLAQTIMTESATAQVSGLTQYSKEFQSFVTLWNPDHRWSTDSLLQHDFVRDFDLNRYFDSKLDDTIETI